MTDKEKLDIKTDDRVTPLRCWLGAIFSGALTFALYTLTRSIATTYANKPVTSTKILAIKIATLVRTLVTGVSTLATAVFAFVTVGLILLGIQLLLHQKTNAD